MLSSFFLIGQEFLRQPGILLGSVSARFGAGDRPQRHPAIPDSGHELRRASCHCHPGMAYIEEIRRWIDQAQRSVDVETVSCVGVGEPLAEHDLERIAGCDVVLGGRDRRLERRSVHRRLRDRTENCLAIQLNGSMRQVRGALSQASPHGVESNDSGVVGCSRVGSGEHVLKQDHLLAESIEGRQGPHHHPEHLR